MRQRRRLQQQQQEMRLLRQVELWLLQQVLPKMLLQRYALKLM